MNKVSRKAQTQGFSSLALAMALPHENKPVRFPVVPATHTALLDAMTDGTVPVYDNSSRRAFLCRDPCYPLWIEKRFVACAGYLQASGSATSWNIPARSNSTLLLPAWDQIATQVGVSPTIDGAVATAATIADHTILGDTSSTQAIYIPPSSTCSVRVFTGAAGGGSGLEVEVVSQVGGEEFTNTLLLAPDSGGFILSGTAGAPLSSGSEGFFPIGFSWIRQIRTTQTAPTAATTPLLQFGWCTGGSVATPSGTADLMVPFAMPPEFNNSTIPYGRSRVNASAALFTNVTAALSKEGTVLAGRLKPAIVDPWNFSVGHLNSVHPALRYFGPLEKGLYTFTTPSGNVSDFVDGWITMPSPSLTNPTARPLFGYVDIGVYNAMVFTDLGSSTAGTQLAVSGYTHIEFETTSSLFNIGVSTFPLETLHSTEVALLKFGHFHENPIHWSVLASAVRQAASYLAPVAAPYVKQLANYVVDKGVQKLMGKQSGDRTMRQAQMVTPSAPRKTTRKPARANRRKRVR